MIGNCCVKRKDGNDEVVGQRPFGSNGSGCHLAAFAPKRGVPPKNAALDSMIAATVVPLDSEGIAILPHPMHFAR